MKTKRASQSASLRQGGKRYIDTNHLGQWVCFEIVSKGWPRLAKRKRRGEEDAL